MNALRLGIVVIGILLMSGGAVVAQESTPAAPDSFELAPGVIADNIVFVEGQENPSLYQLHFAPGVSYSIQASPSLELAYIESGTVTVQLNAPVTVTQLGGENGEVVPADTEVTLTVGQYFVLAPGVTGEVRNDGEETATVSVAGLIPDGMATPPAATPAG